MIPERRTQGGCVGTRLQNLDEPRAGEKAGQQSEQYNVAEIEDLREDTQQAADDPQA
ncbi:MAG TPA: hypothetical protein VHD56_19010 [Tepidisphaeraceae bacterium]|nr:hypothetical protein [Tepidisphaeraceae bacterium]